MISIITFIKSLMVLFKNKFYYFKFYRFVNKVKYKIKIYRQKYIKFSLDSEYSFDSKSPQWI